MYLEMRALLSGMQVSGYGKWSVNGVGCTLVMDIFDDKWGFFDT